MPRQGSALWLQVWACDQRHRGGDRLHRRADDHRRAWLVEEVPRSARWRGARHACGVRERGHRTGDSFTFLSSAAKLFYRRREWPSLPSYCHSPSLDRTTPVRRRGRPICYPQRYPAVARVCTFAAQWLSAIGAVTDHRRTPQPAPGRRAQHSQHFSQAPATLYVQFRRNGWL